MLRPRGGSDFAYSDLEMNILLEDIKIFKEYKADGFVFGALTLDGKIDSIKCKQILEACKPLPVTFHRAFDVCSEPFDSLETIIELGFVRLLTSGLKNNAYDGLDNIIRLVNQAANRIFIMPGSGVSLTNIKDIFFKSGVKEIHASARVKRSVNFPRQSNISFSNDDNNTFVTDSKLVEELVKSIKTF